jgi:hypothetical protein
MPRNTVSFCVLAASPSDVIHERQVIEEVVRDWNSAHSAQAGIILRVLRWELDAVPEVGDRAQAIINKQLVEEADILIGVFLARLGTPTGVAPSGTVEEIERFIELDRPVMLYFSTSPVERNHDPAQLQMLNTYKRQIAATGLYFEFDGIDNLRRMVSRHLAHKMATIETLAKSLVPPKTELMKVYIEKGLRGRSGDVRTVKISAIVENLSPVNRISSYICTLSVPSACLTFESSRYICEIKSAIKGRRSFRRMETNEGAVKMIPPGDRAQILTLDLGIDQLKMKGTWLEGDFEGTLADKVTLDAVVEGEQVHSERSIRDVFEGMV